MWSRLAPRCGGLGLPYGWAWSAHLLEHAGRGRAERPEQLSLQGLDRRAPHATLHAARLFPAAWPGQVPRQAHPLLCCAPASSGACTQVSYSLPPAAVLALLPQTTREQIATDNTLVRTILGTTPRGRGTYTAEGITKCQVGQQEGGVQ